MQALPPRPARTRLPLGILRVIVLARPVIAASFEAWLAPSWLEWDNVVALKTPTRVVGAGAAGRQGEGDVLHVEG